MLLCCYVHDFKELLVTAFFNLQGDKTRFKLHSVHLSRPREPNEDRVLLFPLSSVAELRLKNNYILPVQEVHLKPSATFPPKIFEYTHEILDEIILFRINRKVVLVVTEITRLALDV